MFARCNILSDADDSEAIKAQQNKMKEQLQKGGQTPNAQKPQNQNQNQSFNKSGQKGQQPWQKGRGTPGQGNQQRGGQQGSGRKPFNQNQQGGKKVSFGGQNTSPGFKGNTPGNRGKNFQKHKGKWSGQKQHAN